MKDSFASQRRRPRTTPGERADWVRRYQRCGLSQREFAERHDLGLYSLRKWIVQNGVEAGAAAAARPVWQELKLPASLGTMRWAAEVVRPDGLTVRLAHDAPAALLAELLRARSC